MRVQGKNHAGGAVDYCGRLASSYVMRWVIGQTFNQHFIRQGLYMSMISDLSSIREHHLVHYFRYITSWCCWLLQRWNIFVQTMETKYFFQFEIIRNVLVSSLRLIWIPILWVYVFRIYVGPTLYKCFYIEMFCVHWEHDQFWKKNFY